MEVSIGIKALNEELKIEAALASALAAAEPLRGEVVLADSGSVDRTIEIARRFPVKIVQLANPGERCCGAGAQLAFQFARGEFFYLLDGDMTLSPDFLEAGIGFLKAHPDFAAVGGLVRERNTSGEEYQIRDTSVREGRNWLPGEVDRLDCGGLYRVSAVLQCGYFADRNLHAFEEFELAARLQSRGWKLARINQFSVDHFGHETSGYNLLWRRMKNGYSSASGEVLRASLGHRHFGYVIRKLGHVRNGAAVILWWASLLACPLLPAFPLNALALLFCPLTFLTIRRRSLRLGLYSLAAWNISALGLITGLFRKRIAPGEALAAVEIAEPHGG